MRVVILYPPGRTLGAGVVLMADCEVRPGESPGPLPYIRGVGLDLAASLSDLIPFRGRPAPASYAGVPCLVAVPAWAPPWRLLPLVRVVPRMPRFRESD